MQLTVTDYCLNCFRQRQHASWPGILMKSFHMSQHNRLVCIGHPAADLHCVLLTELDVVCHKALTGGTIGGKYSS